MTQRLFTPAEADKTLPLVKRIVADILSRGKELREAAKLEDRTEAGDRIARLEGEIHEYLQELEQIGCSYKDWNFEVGLVDFPAVIEGESVLLCWRSDEPRVAWYHPEAGGYAMRAPIPEDLLEPSS